MMLFTATTYDVKGRALDTHTFRMPLATTSLRAWSEARSLLGLTGVKGDHCRNLDEWRPRGMGGLYVRLDWSYLWL